MQARIASLYIIFLLLISSVLSVWSQVNNPLLPDSPGEQLQLYTDRGFYCVEEEILFSAHYSIDKSTGLSELSKVLYVELIEWNGKKISAVKVPFVEGIGSGKLDIPRELSSGNYYLRSYTKWMRNFSPYLYSYVPLRIINPYSKEIEKGDYVDAVSSMMMLVGEQTVKEGIALPGFQSEFGSRERVEFDIVLSDKRLSGRYVISISRSADLEDEVSHLSLSPEYQIENHNDKIKFFPENNTISLDGKALHRIDQNPVKGMDVVLCSTLDPFYFFISTTDEKGDFYFSLPNYEGKHQFCLTSLYGAADDVVFHINNDFCTREITLPYIPFKLNEEELSIAMEIVINAQLLKLYKVGDSFADSSDKTPFYGSPLNTIIIDEYIQLRDLREFIFELVPDLNIVGRNNKSYLEFEKRSNLSVFPPLLLIDNIPVPNGEQLLSLPSSSIDRIELISGGYIINNNMFSGLISIFSKEGDLGGMDLQEQNQYFELQLFAGGIPAVDYNPQPSSPHDANTHNLLYFNPGIVLDGREPLTISFNTGDALGRYTLKVRGISDSGDPVLFKQHEFTVK